jgi:FKBP-type peptidyl-prolyl cis-trans isomerase SlyD
MDVSIDGAIATIALPPAINYDRRWLLWRGRIVHETFEYLSDIQEIVLLERFTQPDKKAQAADNE